MRRVAEAIARELQSSLHGFTFAVGHSRVAHDPVDLYRAGNEALLAANVAETRPANIDDPLQVLAFEDTGAYRLLLPAMSEDPGRAPALLHRDRAAARRLRRAVRDRPRADARDLPRVRRQRRRHRPKLYTHRHTVRYRLERVRDLSGLDVGSTDGRERLGLGLKAMRVLGIASPQGPASEAGAGRRPRAPRRQGPVSTALIPGWPTWRASWRRPGARPRSTTPSGGSLPDEPVPLLRRQPLAGRARRRALRDRHPRLGAARDGPRRGVAALAADQHPADGARHAGRRRRHPRDAARRGGARSARSIRSSRRPCGTASSPTCSPACRPRRRATSPSRSSIPTASASGGRSSTCRPRPPASSR